MHAALDGPATNSMGMAVFDNVVELYGVDGAGTMTLHGWFPHATGISLLSNLPPCLIAVDGQAMPAALADSLQGMGHSAYVVPSTSGDEGDSLGAEALWRIAMTEAAPALRSSARQQ